ncbi:MAG: tryptophan-rich sensory protein [Bacilli bacterium]|nr:tryptophan-rich sensory protein [Bacilli bacterium]
MRKKELFFYIIITLVIGAVPSIFVYTNNIYNTLDKPPLSPPGILFPIVWTILFILMGISAYRISIRNSNNTELLIYFIQLIVNALWTPIFFGLNAYLFALIWLILLIVLVVIMISKFYKLDNVSAYLNIPYLIWLLFALYLNFGIYILNK